MGQRLSDTFPVLSLLFFSFHRNLIVHSGTTYNIKNKTDLSLCDLIQAYGTYVHILG